MKPLEQDTVEYIYSLLRVAEKASEKAKSIEEREHTEEELETALKEELEAWQKFFSERDKTL